MGNLDIRHREKFGTCLGVGEGGVEVYSSHYPSADRTDLPNRQAYRSYVDGVFMGYKWQCVELARRWLYINKGYVFDDIAMAYDIFRLRFVTVIADNSKLPLKSFANGAKRHPEPGCLLIWNEGGEFDVTGHVAIVTEVFDDRIRVIEQNVEDKIWPEGHSWSRELAVTLGEDGSYWIDCTFEDAGIMGWVVQTEDATHAELIEDVDTRLFDIIQREAADHGQSADGWLDPAAEDQAAYISAMKGSKLASNDADRFKYLCLTETANQEVKRATNELHAMFMHATNFVLQDDALLRTFNLPPAIWPRIHQSWDNRRNEMITGRFDFSLSARGLKVYEYNCDSASCHMETGVVQEKWAEHYGVTEGRSAGARLSRELVDAWKECAADAFLHIMQDDDPEETYHAMYMKSAIEKAGIPCAVINGVADLRWGDDGQVADAEGRHIDWVWKTWAWETALDEIRDQISEDDENLRLHKTIDRASAKPRLVDVLLRPEVMVFEPLWTLIPSNKAILPVLWMLYPDHPYLLNTGFELTEDLKENGYVVKPIVGRCGHNITICDADDNTVSETAGKFDERDQIYQEMFRLPKIDGQNVQLCTFTAAGTYAGACVRVDPSPIITTNSDILPLRIIPDPVFK
jgi:glutathionylspermidine amidase/synthetase